MWVQLYLKKQFIFLTKAVTIAVQSNSGPQRSEPTTRKLEIQINPGATKILGLPKKGGEPKMSPLNQETSKPDKKETFNKDKYQFLKCKDRVPHFHLQLKAYF